MFDSERNHMIIDATDEAAVADAASRARLSAITVAPRLWRIADPWGRVIGHVQSIGDGDDRRFRAQRYRAELHAFRVLGDFWSCEQAVECVRLSR